jgi:hypothetical protein
MLPLASGLLFRLRATLVSSSLYYETPWPESASEPTERPYLSPKLVPTFADREVSRSQRDASLPAVILVF